MKAIERKILEHLGMLLNYISHTQSQDASEGFISAFEKIEKNNPGLAMRVILLFLKLDQKVLPINPIILQIRGGKLGSPIIQAGILATKKAWSLGLWQATQHLLMWDAIFNFFRLQAQSYVGPLPDQLTQPAPGLGEQETNIVREILSHFIRQTSFSK